MIHLKSLDEVSIIDIEKLIEEKVLENRFLEYKENFGDYRNKSLELLKDFIAFLNSDGGDILFGIEDISGIPSKIKGIELKDADSFKLFFENQVALFIQPKANHYSFGIININQERGILILRIYKNYNTPYMIKKDLYSGFIYRGESGNIAMDFFQIKSYILNSIYEKETLFIFLTNRYQYINSSDFQYSKLYSPKIIVHSIPVDSYYRKNDSIKLKNISKEAEDHFREILRPNEKSVIYNVDGFLLFDKSYESTNSSIQFFRDGTIEYINEKEMSYSQGIDISFIDGLIFTDIINEFITFQKKYMYSQSYLIAISIINSRGLKFYLNNSVKSIVFNRSNINFPIIEIDSNDKDFSERINPLREILWNIAGINR